MLSSKCVCVCVCDIKISRFIKEQEISGLLSNLEMETLFNHILLVGPLLF